MHYPLLSRRVARPPLLHNLNRHQRLPLQPSPPPSPSILYVLRLSAFAPWRDCDRDLGKPFLMFNLFIPQIGRLWTSVMVLWRRREKIPVGKGRRNSLLRSTGLWKVPISIFYVTWGGLLSECAQQFGADVPQIMPERPALFWSHGSAFLPPSLPQM